MTHGDTGKRQLPWGWLAVLGFLPLLGACGGGRIHLDYPAEQIDFSLGEGTTPRVYLGVVQDLRPTAQRRGQGRFLSLTYPGDDAWQEPVTDVYREALRQDLSQTRFVELVPLVNQADYTLSADLMSMACRLERSPVSYLLPLAAGMGAGVVVGETSSDKIRNGLVIGVLALMAIPLPTPNSAEAEVRLTLTDAEGTILWQRTCLGEFSENAYISVTARDDQKLVNKYLARAIKRCNGCLLGQLRQELLQGGE